MRLRYPCFEIREQQRGIDRGGPVNEVVCSPAAGDSRAATWHSGNVLSLFVKSRGGRGPPVGSIVDTV
jgi:hypothetical protein